MGCGRVCGKGLKLCKSRVCLAQRTWHSRGMCAQASCLKRWRDRLSACDNQFGAVQIVKLVKGHGVDIQGGRPLRGSETWVMPTRECFGLFG